MVWIKMESSQYTTSDSFGEIINKFEHPNVNETFGLLKENREKKTSK